MWRRILLSREAGIVFALIVMATTFSRAFPFLVALGIFWVLVRARSHGDDDW